ncbi:MAG: Modification methylase DpnIIB [Alphaproteobacteria bacterium MarineAlpha9_Bin4]|nr:DNA methyltransferase [Pelagibacterales bacterium]PPR27187.1 MAG: Modification methylase DpnIIB [Alphaproteobacteria bacterium MarineAlpha9_Bin4]|tara:strand:+ start:393 stop:1496 length:1104 start_codon:yes stop_codon:yes gene_type:complete
MFKTIKKLKIRNSKFILGNSLNELKDLETSSVDMIFCDPPYFLQLSKELRRPDMTVVKGVEENWDKFSSYAEYDEFTSLWLKECKRILKQDGTIWLIGTYHNIYRLGFHLQNLNFWILNDIIWNKVNPLPNFKGTRFTNAHEIIIWATKSKESKYTFNYHTMKKMNNNKQMRSDWSLKVCQGKERLKNEFKKTLHSTQKPEQLLERIVLASTRPGDLILDPFFGTGTTGAVCKKLGRNFIGIEKNSLYMKAAKQRIMQVEPIDTSAIEEVSNKNLLKKVPFSDLLKKGLIQPGERIFNSKKNIEATILPNGNLKFKKREGSIHKIGAYVQNKAACNGWTYWYVKSNKKMVSINDHRNLLRTENSSKE